MTACPDLGALEEVPLPPPISAHVADCPACRMVVDVFAGAGEADLADCVRFDALLAARADGSLNPAGKSLLDRHLASCAACRQVAETLSPIADTDGDHATLPEVDPSAYALGLEVARGGMGRILAARDLRVGRPVAVKELLGRAPELAARFEREARVTARLQHPGIVPIYEIGRWPDGTPFYAMRMVEGHTLLEAIDAARTLAARLALVPAVIAAAEAVAFAHAQRVIHRDLTPSNVLVGAYGETVVIDWGLAKDLTEGVAGEPDAGLADPGDSSTESLTADGMVIGTAAYMPPEQAHAIPVDERADVYALGAILYHLLAGGAPYRAKSTRELLREVRTGPPPPIGELAPAAPRDLVSIVTKAMARDPEQRYPSARELTEELHRFQTGRMVAAHAYSGLERIRRVIRRNKGAVAVATLALVLLAAMSTLAISRVLRSRAEARNTVRELLVEKGRVELLDGSPLRALAYLEEASKQGIDTPALTFLINSAMDGVPQSERLLDCGGDVRYVEFSADGKRMVAACHDVARMWNVADGTVVMSLGEIKSGFDRIDFSHDGRLLVSYGAAHEARVWDATTGQQRGVFPHGAGINVALFTPDDRRLVTIGHDGKAAVWSVADASLQRTIVAKATGVLYLYGALGGDGTHLLTLSMEGEGRGWDLDTGALLGGFEHGGGALLLGADLSRDGSRAVTCGNDRLSKVWDATTGAHLLTVGGHTDVLWKCMFSPDGKQLLTAGHDGRAMIWDVATGASISAVDHGDIVLWARFAPDGSRFLTAGVDGIVKVWDLRSGALLASHDSMFGKDAHFSPDGSRLVAQRGDGRIQVWREATATVESFVAPAGSSVIATSRSGGRTLVEGPDHAITIHDTASGAALRHAAIHAPVALSRDATTLAAATAGGVLVVELETGATRRMISMTEPSALEIDDAGARLIAMHKGAAPELWEVGTGARLAEIPNATQAVPSRHGTRVLAWTAAHAPFVWDVDTQRPIATLATLGPQSSFVPIGFSGDDTRIALVETAPDTTRQMTLWDATATAAPLRIAADTSFEPTWNPSGTHLTTIGPDGDLTVWSASDGTPQTSFVFEQLLQAQANGDGSLIAGIGDNGATMLVLSTDGRVLQRSPIEHRAPAVSPLGFDPAEAKVWWSNRDDRIVTVSAGVVVTPVSTRPDPGRLRALSTRALPWRLDGGRLVPIEAVVLRGTVLRDGQPVEGAEVIVERRTPPHHGAAPVDYGTKAMKVTTQPARTDREGRFELDGPVRPGLYNLTVRSGELARSFPTEIAIGSGGVTLELGQ